MWSMTWRVNEVITYPNADNDPLNSRDSREAIFLL